MAGVIERMSETALNPQLSFKPATRLLRQCGCAITVSSTAALEAMALGTSTALLAISASPRPLASLRRLAPWRTLPPSPVIRSPQATGWNGFNAVASSPRAAKPSSPLCWSDSSSVHRCPLMTSVRAAGAVTSGTHALRRGRRMPSSAGARSSQRKRHKTRTALRRLRDGLVGFGWLSRWLRER